MKKFVFGAVVIMIGIASGCSKKTSPETANAAPLDGAKLFAKKCARCHGKAGVKDERTPNLQTIPMDKTALVNAINKGTSKGMPAFEGKLSESEMGAIADLILSWHK